MGVYFIAIYPYPTHHQAEQNVMLQSSALIRADPAFAVIESSSVGLVLKVSRHFVSDRAAGKTRQSICRHGLYIHFYFFRVFGAPVRLWLGSSELD